MNVGGCEVTPGVAEQSGDPTQQRSTSPFAGDNTAVLSFAVTFTLAHWSSFHTEAMTYLVSALHYVTSCNSFLL
jgi:hypothetical protein